MEIKAVIFDMFETLVTHYKHPLYFGEQIAEDIGIPNEDFQRIWSASEEDRTIGKRTLETVLTEILEENHIYSKEKLNYIVSKRIAIKQECFDDLDINIIPMLEELKRKNPRAYEHEYMGKAVGTGGDVFPNVEEFDSMQEVSIYDAYGNIVGKRPMWMNFDRIYCGLDWGFAIDPLRFVRMHFDRKHYDLYIFREFSALQMGNRESYNMIYNVHKLITNQELLTADSAEPKSIMDYKNYGAYIRGADKGPDSVRYGIKWLQALNHIYIDRKMCPETFKEFSTYEYEQDKDGNFISAYPDENNHSIDAARYGTEKFWIRKGN